MWLDPARAVADFPFYRSLPQKSLGSTVGYLAYLGVLFSLVSVAALLVRAAPIIEEAVAWASAAIPPMTLSGGRLSSPLQEPVRLQYPGQERLAFILDTARTTPPTAQEMDEKKVIAYFIRDSVTVAGRDRLEVYDLSASKDAPALTIDGNFYRSLGDLFKKALGPVGFAFTWVLFMAWKHLAALMYALVALLLNALLSAGLEFPALYRVSVYAQTPVIVLQAAALFLPAPIPLFGLLSLLVGGLYLWQAIRQIQGAS
ncbi:MAG: DUF1189 family protein [Elusimicrobiota bacterium]